MGWHRELLLHQAFRSKKGQQLSFCDVGGLWNTTGEQVTLASQYTNDLTIIDPIQEGWPEKMAEHLKKHNVSATIHNMDVIDYDERQFDIVFCGGVLYHFGDPNILWSKLRKLTKKDLVLGSLVVPGYILSHGRKWITSAKSTPAMELAAGNWAKYCPNQIPLRDPLDTTERYGPTCWMYTPSQILHEARQHGFRVATQIIVNDSFCCQRLVAEGW